MADGMTQEQFLVEHLKSRIAEIVSDYESRLGIAALRIQMLTQEVQSLSQENQPQPAPVDHEEQKLN